MVAGLKPMSFLFEIVRDPKNPAGFNPVFSGIGVLKEDAELVEAIRAALQALIDVPVIQQVHLFYRADLLDLNVAPGEESLETRLFPLRHIPWDELAFETVRAALAHHLRHPRHGVLVKTLGQRPARSSA